MFPTWLSFLRTLFLRLTLLSDSEVSRRTLGDEWVLDFILPRVRLGQLSYLRYQVGAPSQVWDVPVPFLPQDWYMR